VTLQRKLNIVSGSSSVESIMGVLMNVRLLCLYFILTVASMPAFTPSLSLYEKTVCVRATGWAILDIGILIADHSLDNHLDAADRGDYTRNSVSAFDRWAVRPKSDGLAEGSDYLLASMCGGTVFLLADNSCREDFLVLGEALLAQSALANISKSLVQRPRPYTYDSETSDTDFTHRDAIRSFYSGHTSAAFCMATVVDCLHRRDNGPDWRVTTALYTMAGGVGALRVASGSHFPTDVVVGASVGTLVGWTLTRSGHVEPLIGTRSLGFRYRF
jgi:undecaprenyl-diphosphatase